jgi:aspartyl-tRNA(Asn)/glutamyl-tRNA(Gln) amidotransferase subunit C
MDSEQVKKLAHLARLNVPEAELANVANDIGNILGFIDQIQKVDLGTAVENNVQKINIFRDDVIAPITPVYDLVEAAPLHKDHFVMVPKVLE